MRYSIFIFYKNFFDKKLNTILSDSTKYMIEKQAGKGSLNYSQIEDFILEDIENFVLSLAYKKPQRKHFLKERLKELFSNLFASEFISEEIDGIIEVRTTFEVFLENKVFRELLKSYQIIESETPFKVKLKRKANAVTK